MFATNFFQIPHRDIAMDILVSLAIQNSLLRPGRYLHLSANIHASQTKKKRGRKAPLLYYRIIQRLSSTLSSRRSVKTVDISGTLALGLCLTIIGGQRSIDNYLVTSSHLAVSSCPFLTTEPVYLKSLKVLGLVIVVSTILRDKELLVSAK